MQQEGSVPQLAPWRAMAFYVAFGLLWFGAAEVLAPHWVDDPVALPGLLRWKTYIFVFITGLLAGNYDITHIYIDPVFKMCGRDFEAFTQMVNTLDSLRATQDVQIVFTLSCEPEDLPYHLRDMMIENW